MVGAVHHLVSNPTASPANDFSLIAKRIEGPRRSFEVRVRLEVVCHGSDRIARSDGCAARYR